MTASFSDRRKNAAIVAHVSDHAVRLDFVAPETGLVDERHRRLKQAAVFPRHLDRSEIRSDDNWVVTEPSLRGVRQERHRREVIDRHVEEPFDSRGMGVDEHQTVEPACGDDVGRHARTE